MGHMLKWSICLLRQTQINQKDSRPVSVNFCKLKEVLKPDRYLSGQLHIHSFSLQAEEHLIDHQHDRWQLITVRKAKEEEVEQSFWCCGKKLIERYLFMVIFPMRSNLIQYPNEVLYRIQRYLTTASQTDLHKQNFITRFYLQLTSQQESKLIPNQASQDTAHFKTNETGNTLFPKPLMPQTPSG